MKKGNEPLKEEDTPSRRQFINKAGLVTSGAILGYITLLSACDMLESTKTETVTPSQTFTYTIPVNITRIENLPEVRTALRNEKEQLDAFINDLGQLQLDMNELYDSFERLENMDDKSQERMLILQILMDKKDQAEKTISNILKVFQNTQRDIVSNLK